MELKKKLHVCSFAIAIFLLSAGGVVNAQTVVDRIVAVVGKEIITLSDLNLTIQSMAMQNRIDPNAPGLRDRVLDGMINEKLILAQAIRDSVEVTNDEVTDRLDRQIKMLVQQAGSEQRLEEMYNMPISRMKRDFRDLIRNQLLVEKVRQTHQASITVTRREVEEFFEAHKDSLPTIPTEYELSHIFMKPKPDTSVVEAVYNKALLIRDSILAGGNFADFAKRYSSDPGSAAAGGDLGWIRRGVFEKEFEEAAYALKDSEISEPVRTSYGYHLIQLIERRGESVHTRHILFSIVQSKADDDSTIAELQRLRARALAGENFAALARRYSEDEETKDIGGDLGKIGVDQIEASFLDVLKTMKAGEISEPVKVPLGSSYGYHIVWVRSITPEHAMNLTDDYQRLEQFALQFKINENFQQWVEEMKKNIYWEKKL
ncbi:MAG TPA: peptidylprolyl isomerase [Bacteroidota bacterium]|nr:peptidylprolyl isomerase [Bacteroidota bacterium]